MESVFVGLIRFMDPDPGRFFSLFESYKARTHLICQKQPLDFVFCSFTCVEDIMTCSKALFIEAMECGDTLLPDVVIAQMPGVTSEADDGVNDLGDIEEGETRFRTE